MSREAKVLRKVLSENIMHVVQVFHALGKHRYATVSRMEFCETVLALRLEVDSSPELCDAVYDHLHATLGMQPYAIPGAIPLAELLCAKQNCDPA